MTGRPVEENPRDVRVVIRVLPDERDRWVRRATRDGMTLSAWIRELANGVAPAKRGRK